jgi:hypothetical protein
MQDKQQACINNPTQGMHAEHEQCCALTQQNLDAKASGSS